MGGAGLASCYSFQSNKNMTTLGEGGAITTDDGDFAERVRGLKTFGYVYGGPQLRVTQIGFNYRMTKAAGRHRSEPVVEDRPRCRGSADSLSAAVGITG